VVEDETLVEGETVPDPESFVSRLRDAGLNADIFTFAQKLPDVAPKHKCYFEWDNVAAVTITSVSHWLEKHVEHDVRSAIKKASRLGVVVKLADFDDAFVEGIVGIYNESPIRQRKAFSHYQKDFVTVRKEASTYLERSAFIGAYYEDELIGFIKLVYVGGIEAIALHVVSQTKHFNRKPTNALIAKAVEVCEQKGISYLTYGKYIYNDPSSSLTEFKRRNGFRGIQLPRYYLPLTLRGRIALKLRLHHGVVGMLPQTIVRVLLKVRSRLWRFLSRWYGGRFPATRERA